MMSPSCQSSVVTQGLLRNMAGLHSSKKKKELEGNTDTPLFDMSCNVGDASMESPFMRLYTVVLCIH